MELFVGYMERYDKMKINPPPMGAILLEAGYTKSVSTQPHKIVNSKAWKHFMEDVDDTEIVQRWREWALDDDPKNRSVAIKAGENIMKLKDRFPGSKGRVAHIHGELSDLFIKGNEDIHSEHE